MLEHRKLLNKLRTIDDELNEEARFWDGFAQFATCRRWRNLLSQPCATLALDAARRKVLDGIERLGQAETHADLDRAANAIMATVDIIEGHFTLSTTTENP